MMRRLKWSTCLSACLCACLPVCLPTCVPLNAIEVDEEGELYSVVHMLHVYFTLCICDDHSVKI